MNDYPRMLAEVGHTAPVPRRVRGFLGGRPVFDTIRARYVWEWPNYPQYYIPFSDVDADLLRDDGVTRGLHRGPARMHSLVVGTDHRPGCVGMYTDAAPPDISGMLRFDWEALDSWWEEDEEVFVHPRNPYTRVDAIRSTRQVRVELDGLVLAESRSPVMVFETGLPTRYYLNPTEVNFKFLRASETVTSCPYKGRTTGYWSVLTGAAIHPDLAWSYHFPTRQLLPIAGLIAFYNEKVDTVVDGVRLPRPSTHLVS